MLYNFITQKHITHINPNTASRELQDHLNSIQIWLKSWRVKVNETKSAHVTFTLKKRTCPAVSLNGVKIPKVSDVKYLGMHLDSKLNWSKHIITKRKQLNIQKSKMYWLIGRKSKLSIENKALLYKAILKPIWTYGIHLRTDLVQDVINKYSSKYQQRLQNHPNSLAASLINQPKFGRLKRITPKDLPSRR